MSTTNTTSPNGSYTASGANQSIGGKARQFAEETIEEGAEYAEMAEDMAAEKLGEIETYIRRNPLQAAAIAAGIGFVVALNARR